MTKGLLIGVILVVVLLFLGIGFLTALNYNTDDNNEDYNNYNNQYSNNTVQNNPDNSALPYTNPCGLGESYDYLCFKYQMLEQERRDGYSNGPEQIRVEPCPTPKPVCPLCSKGLDQSRGQGYDNSLEQNRINC